MTPEEINHRYQIITAKIAHYCQEAGRDPASVQLIAVSKTQPSSAIRNLAQLTPQRIFGENYADELFKKSSELQDLSLSWHYIGKLQSNKIRRLVQSAACIQTVESEKHLRFIARHAEEIGKTPYPIFICVNAANEPQKSGVALDDAHELAQIASESYPAIRVCGMMTIPPASFQDAACAEVPALYQHLRTASRAIGAGQLSLGMTGDLRIAILAGSTMVRVGTAIFGERDYDNQPPSEL